MKHLFFVTLLLSALTVSSCEKAKDAAKDAINKGGETVGKGATEFIEGVTEGVDRTLDFEISFSKALQDAGLKSGKYTADADPKTGNSNKLTLYIIFEKDLNRTVAVKVFDKNGLETGRTSALLSGKKGEAKYFDFTFDPRTNMEKRSKIVIE